MALCWVGQRGQRPDGGAKEQTRDISMEVEFLRVYSGNERAEDVVICNASSWTPWKKIFLEKSARPPGQVRLASCQERAERHIGQSGLTPTR